jgi:hypothetical protein
VGQGNWNQLHQSGSYSKRVFESGAQERLKWTYSPERLKAERLKISYRTSKSGLMGLDKPHQTG